jgi:hypothetical protein
MSHAELAETAEREKLLFSESSVSSSEAHEPLTWFGAGGREIMTIFLDKKNTIQIKALKYSLACAIQGILRVSKLN